MVNGGDLFVCVVVGMAIPLALLDGFKVFAAATLPSQTAGLHLERRPFVWLLAILLGPGLFMERMLAAEREGRLSPADRINAFVIALGWAAIYGYVVLSLAKALLPR